MTIAIKDQMRRFIHFLNGSQFSADSPVFGKALQFVYILKQHPTEYTPKEVKDLRVSIQKAFILSENDLDLVLSGVGVEEFTNIPKAGNQGVEDAKRIEAELWTIIPKEGFLYDYCCYTKNHEGPLAYHVFVALAGVGSVLNRRVWYNMGFYKLYPATGIILLGPSGVKKTTSADIIVSMLQEWDYCNIYSEKMTPEYLLTEVALSPTGLLYAPELSAFLGKQKYMEGIVPTLTRLMDHKTFPTGTKGGGKVVITDPAPSFIGCTTPDWFVTNTPPDTFGGGFVARLIIIAQDSSARVESSPGRDSEGKWKDRDSSDHMRKKMQLYLGQLLDFEGEMEFTPEAFKIYDKWYLDSKPLWRAPEVPLLGTYYQRKADHVKRLAMCLHLADHQTMTICASCFITSVKLLDWMEQFIAPVYKEMFKTSSGIDNEIVIKAIRSAGGFISHTNLVRAVQYRMDANRLKIILQSLTESHIIEEKREKLGTHCYMLTQ